jgi:Uma2 family endonuclease
MAAKEFLELPEDPDNTRYELMRGEVVVSPSPNLDHAFVARNLSFLLLDYTRRKSLGEIIEDTDTYFGPEDVRRPDIMYFSNARLHFIGDNYLEGPPDLAVEVLSPSNKHVDRGDKFELYRDSGVTFYWIFDPMLRTVEAYKLQGKEYVDVGSGKDADVLRLPPFEDLEIDLAQIWRQRKNT